VGNVFTGLCHCVEIIDEHTGNRMTKIGVQLTKLLQEEFRLSFH